MKPLDSDDNKLAMKRANLSEESLGANKSGGSSLLTEDSDPE